MVRRRRGYDRHGKADGKVTYSRYNAAGFAAAVPSPLPGSVAIDPCHDRDTYILEPGPEVRVCQDLLFCIAIGVINQVLGFMCTQN